jgi:hypothetical protein
MDLEPNPSAETQLQQPPPKKSGVKGIWIATAILALVVIAGFLGWRAWLSMQTPGPELVPPPVVKPPDAIAGPVVAADGDTLLKGAAAGLSPEAILSEWLSLPGIVQRLVAATFSVSRGESPRELLSFMKPAGAFSVDEESEKLPPGPKVKPKKGKKAPPPPKAVVHSFINSASYARYDTVAKVIGSIDLATVGKLYAKLRPYADAAFREAGPPGKKFDDTFAAAVDHLAEVPISDARLEVVPLDHAVGYRYLDPKLEGLTAAQKHLLRMGPANARIIVAKLKELRTAAFSN